MDGKVVIGSKIDTRELKDDLKSIKEESKRAGEKVSDSFEKSGDKVRKESNKTKEETNKDQEEVSKKANEESRQTEHHWGKAFDGIKSVGGAAFNSLKTVTGAAVKGTIAGIGAMTTGLAGLSVASVKAYAEYEQLVGGVETLFKDSAPVVKKYADQAYKTAGMSANKYMETVTSFSASLLQSLDGDTNAAAEAGNQAIIDMSDNANKMGTSMESIQNAYQGFAKQNYTMLDNLKLGYGGTKAEMERLLEDAEEISGIHYDIDNLSDVYSAIHVIQTELDITGTTALESSSTIEGSINSLQSAFENLLVGISDDSADFDLLVDNFVTSLSDVIENLLPRFGVALEGVGSLVGSLSNLLIENIGGVVDGIAQQTPNVINSAVQIISNLLAGLNQNAPQVANAAFAILSALANGVVTILPQIIPLAINIISTLLTGLRTNAPRIAESSLNILEAIADGIISILPQVADTALEIILALGNGLAERAPELVPKAVEVILDLAQYLLDNLPKIIEVAGKIIVGLGEGLINSIPVLVEKAPDIIKGIADALKAEVSTIKDVGKNLVEGLWNGISDMTSWIIDKVKGFGGDILGGLKDFFGIHSPSKVMEKEIGQWLAKGVGVGFDKYNPMVQIKHTLDTGMNGIQSLFANAGTSTTYSPTNYFYGMETPDQIANRLDLDAYYMGVA